jgi:uncharacterized repeat protein (TIGR03837 family)
MVATSTSRMSAYPRRWDVFCKVVDNFGDAGVSWRLARQLAAEHALDVTLWLDQLPVLARLAPGVSPELPVQTADGVTIRKLEEPPAGFDPADVVIDAFGGGLPDRYVAAIAARAAPPCWFVLEYLSAEAWIEGSHGLASPHPQWPIARRFWFPGYTARTGGLLRERDLLARRDAFRAGPDALAALWSSLGVPAPGGDEIRVSLFCYACRALPDLLDAWGEGDVPIVCLVPEGVATGAIDAWAGGSVPHARGEPIVRGRLELHAIPFVDQDSYDRLLWACDINFVRGEDSFVRAQWAARPFAWHLYPQAEGAHFAKLDAFLDRYTAGLAGADASAACRWMRAWNGDENAGPVAAAWLDFAAARPRLMLHGETWARTLAALPDLASTLVKAALSAV